MEDMKQCGSEYAIQYDGSEEMNWMWHITTGQRSLKPFVDEIIQQNYFHDAPIDRGDWIVLSPRTQKFRVLPDIEFQYKYGELLKSKF